MTQCRCRVMLGPPSFGRDRSNFRLGRATFLRGARQAAEGVAGSRLTILACPRLAACMQSPRVNGNRRREAQYVRIRRRLAG
jgi:hypothetical protein